MSRPNLICVEESVVVPYGMSNHIHTDVEAYTQIVEELSEVRAELLEVYNEHVRDLGHELALKRAIRELPDTEPIQTIASAYRAEYGNRMLSMILDEIQFFQYAIKHLTKYTK